jgi:hypothetical protein
MHTLVTSILPKNNLELRASINDILNQNKGYERTTTNNTNTERYFQTLGRYWMISAVWNFSTGPMAESKAPVKGRGKPPKNASWWWNEENAIK